MGRILYYLDDFLDEMIPCTPSLAGWAEWLARPEDDPDVEGWNRGPVEAGHVFATTVVEHMGEIEATRTVDGWDFDVEPPPNLSLCAESYGRGMGWDIDNSNDNLDDFLKCQIDGSQLHGLEIGASILIAICRDLPGVMVRFERNPEPRCTIVEAVQ